MEKFKTYIFSSLNIRFHTELHLIMEVKWAQNVISRWLSMTICLEGKQAVLYLQESTASCKIFVVLARVLSLGVVCEISTAYLKLPTFSGCSLPVISATVLNESTSGSVWAPIVRRNTILWPLRAILAIIWASSIVMQAVGIWGTPGWYHCQPVWGLKITPRVG